MAGHGIASSSSSHGNTNSHVYDIFLNHRGPDEKKGLASDIYRRLIVRGFSVFLDQPELRKGEDMPSQIKEAIRTASLHLAIFSPTYAQSRWCLDELALMVESGSTIIPVFHDVDPADLRWTRSGDGVHSILRCICPCPLGEKGRYARDLHMLQKKTTLDPETNMEKPRYDSSTLEKWRNALSVVSNISGFDMNACDGGYGKLVDEVVEEVWRKVGKTPLNVAKYPTGLDEKIEHLEEMVLLQQQTQKSRVVGIVGLGGVGKSTLAKKFFNKHRSNYDRYCFLSDVRETAAKNSLSSLQTALLRDLADLNQEQISNTDEGIEKLRKHLSSSRSSLIVLDDVDHIDQLDALFSPVKNSIKSSSLILVTSRNRDVLTSSGIEEASIYKQTGLNRQHSKDLFCSHAFDQTCPVTGFEKLVEDFLDFCDGLPLSLKVIGAAIRGKDSKFWKSHLHKISIILPSDIHSKLKISYDGLDEEEQDMFLDVACFFIGENRDTAIRIWNGSGWDGWLGLRNLENRCLVEVDSEDCIRMHDHLRDLGRYVAEKEHVRCQLRLSRPNVNLLPNLSGLSHLQVRGISMDYGNGHEQFFENVAGHCNLSSLKLLRSQGSFVERVVSAGELQQLIYLRWERCPISSICLPILTRNLRVLYIQGNNLETLWQHESEAPIQLRELYINAPLSDVPESIGKLNQLEKIVLQKCIFKTLPNVFSQMHCLKYISLDFCKEMMLLPDSVGQLTGLQSIDLSTCLSLQGLPDSVGQLTSLQSINLSWCTSLQGLPDSVGQLTGLQSINLWRCKSLQRLPDSVGQLTGLQSINLSWCTSLQRLPDSVGQLTGLQSINLANCSSLQRLPDSVGQLTGLQSINLWRCKSLQRLPDSVGQLTGLQSINLWRCKSLQRLPDSVGQLTGLQSINLSWCTSLQRLPDSVGQLTGLQSINLANCSSLQRLPDSVGQLTGLQSINLCECSSLQGLPDSVGQLMGLQTLNLVECYSLQRLPDSVGQLTGLQSINLKNCHRLQGLPDSVGQLTGLQSINLKNCCRLQGLPDSVGQLTGLQTLKLVQCSSLQGLPDSVGQLRGLKIFDLRSCSSLQGLPDSVGQLTGLKILDLRSCSSLQGLPELTGLQSINLEDRMGLQGLTDSVGLLTSLQSIDLWGCSSLQGLPDSVGQLTSLQSINLWGCSSLQGLPDSVGKLTGLRTLNFTECSSLQGLPDSVGQLTGLRTLNFTECFSLRALPDSVGQLTGLHTLNFTDCSSLQGLPDSVGQLTGLHSITLWGCSSLQGLPDSVGQLTGLQSIDLRRCSSLQGLPDSVGQLTGLQSIELWRCSSLQDLPDSVGQLTGLQRIDLWRCSSLQGLPDSVGQLTGLQTLDFTDCSSLQGLPDSFANLTGLKCLNLNGCSNLQMLPNFQHLSSLEKLYLSGCSNLQMPLNVQHLNSLVNLDVSDCSKLQWGAGIVEELRQRLGINFIEEGSRDFEVWEL